MPGIFLEVSYKMGIMGWLMSRGLDNVTPEEVKKMMEEKAEMVLLDVRTPMETSRGVIKGAKLIPMSELQARSGELPKNKDIIVYCAVGNRSAAATRFLNNMGFERAKNMTGGYAKWKRL